MLQHDYIGQDIPRTERIARVFALYKAHQSQISGSEHWQEYRVPSPAFARDFQSRALASLRFGGNVSQSSGSDARNPEATTNFSELSARDAGGFTFATLAKRCFNSF